MLFIVVGVSSFYAYGPGVMTAYIRLAWLAESRFLKPLEAILGACMFSCQVPKFTLGLHRKF